MPAFLVDTVQVDEEQVAAAASVLKSLSLVDVVKLAVLVIVLIVLVNLLSRLFTKLIQRSKLDPSAHSFLIATIKVILWFVAATIVAAGLGVDITSLIAVLSVAGLAVSLALQGALANLASGLVILTTKPFRVGDYVLIGGNEGFVREISMTYTRIVSWDARTIFVPNSTVTVSEVVNYSTDGMRRIDMNFSVGYDNDVETVKSSLIEAMNNIPQVRKDLEIFARVNAYEASSIQYQARCWCVGEDYWDVWFGLLEEAKKTFDRNGVTFSYDHLNVHMMKE